MDLATARRIEREGVASLRITNLATRHYFVCEAEGFKLVDDESEIMMDIRTVSEQSPEIARPFSPGENYCFILSWVEPT